MGFLRQYSSLPTTIYVLSFTRATVSMGSMIIFPFLSLMLTTHLGYNESTAGIIIFFTSLSNVSGSVAGGFLADAFDRKRIIIISSSIVAVFAVIISAILPSKMTLLAIIIMFFAFSTIFPTISAMILDYSLPTNKSECFSLMYLSSNIGSALGPILTGLLFYSHMSWIFLCSALLFLITIIAVVFGIREHAKEKIATRDGIGFSFSLLTVPLILFCLCLAIFNLSYISLDFVLPLQLSDYFGLNAGSKYSSLIWSINGLAVVFLTPVIIFFSKKINHILSVAIGGIFYAIGFMIYAVSKDMVLLLLTTLVWTVGEILISTSAGIFIADHLPSGYKGRSMALYEFSCAVGKLIAPVGFGFILYHFAYLHLWIVIVLLCIIFSVVTFLLYFNDKKREVKK